MNPDLADPKFAPIYGRTRFPSAAQGRSLESGGHWRWHRRGRGGGLAFLLVFT